MKMDRQGQEAPERIFIITVPPGTLTPAALKTTPNPPTALKTPRPLQTTEPWRLQARPANVYQAPPSTVVQALPTGQLALLILAISIAQRRDVGFPWILGF